MRSLGHLTNFSPSFLSSKRKAAFKPNPKSGVCPVFFFLLFFSFSSTQSSTLTVQAKRKAGKRHRKGYTPPLFFISKRKKNSCKKKKCRAISLQFFHPSLPSPPLPVVKQLRIVLRISLPCSHLFSPPEDCSVSPFPITPISKRVFLLLVYCTFYFYFF